MIHMTSAEEVVKAVMNMVVGYWSRSRSQSYCLAVGMPCVPVVGNCRLDKVYPNSRVHR
jgi:hypothetical protein